MKHLLAKNKSNEILEKKLKTMLIKDLLTVTLPLDISKYCTAIF
jgi:hypothetical protein